jgi:hypothetical protein
VGGSIRVIPAISYIRDRINYYSDVSVSSQMASLRTVPLITLWLRAAQASRMWWSDAVETATLPSTNAFGCCTIMLLAEIDAEWVWAIACAYETPWVASKSARHADWGRPLAASAATLDAASEDNPHLPSSRRSVSLSQCLNGQPWCRPAEDLMAVEWRVVLT